MEAPNCCAMSPISGLRSRTLNGPFAPARGPANRCSTIARCGGVISAHVSGLNLSPRSSIFVGSGFVCDCGAGACAEVTPTRAMNDALRIISRVMGVPFSVLGTRYLLLATRYLLLATGYSVRTILVQFQPYQVPST